MKCELCKTQTSEQPSEFNQLKINEDKTVFICQECIKKFGKWQQELFAKIYPTTMAKKWVKRKS